MKKVFEKLAALNSLFSSLENFSVFFSVFFYAIQKLDNGDFVGKNGQSIFFLLFPFSISDAFKIEQRFKKKNANYDGLGWDHRERGRSDEFAITSRRNEELKGS